MELHTILHQVISKDGTPIAYQQVGNGPPLLLVHGTGGDRSRWMAAAPRLAQHFSVYMMDRRGRGASGDAGSYAIEQEYADIAAVAGRIAACTHQPVHVLGHSFGAACVLGAAPAIPDLGRLILYEPPMLAEQYSSQRDEVLSRMEQALAAGDREAVVTIMTVEMLRVPAAAVARMQATPMWQSSLAAAGTIPRELRSSAAYGASIDTLKTITAPTLFLLGSDSPESFKVTTETLHGLIPTSQIVILPGQQHSAMLTAPDLFAGEVTRFLLS